MVKGLIFVGNKRSKRSLKRFIKEQVRKGNSIACLGDKLSGCEVDQQIIYVKHYQERVQGEKNYWEIAKTWLDEWNRGTQLYKEVLYEGFSLWWFVRFSFCHWLRKLLSDIDAVKEILANEKPEAIYGIGIGGYWEDVIKAVAERNNIAINLISRSSLLASFFDKDKQFGAKVREVFPYLTVKILRTIQGAIRLWLRNIRKKQAKALKALMFTHAIDWQSIKDPLTGCAKKFDAQMGLVLDELLKRNIEVVAFDMMSYPKSGLATLFEKKYPYVPLETSQDWIKELWEIHVKKSKVRKFLGKWSLLKKDADFRNSFRYDGINIGRITLKKLEAYFTRSFPSLITAIESYRSVLLKERPNIIIAMDENGSGRPLVTAAKILGIPTMGFQHGAIGKWSLSYIYPQDVERDTIPLCDKTVVFGKFYKDILVKESVYGNSEVEVTGQSRLDLFKHKDKICNREALFKSLNIPLSTKLVVFTSQTGELSRRREAARLVFDGLQEMKDIFLVIKLHPGEKMDGFYERLAKECKFSNLKVSKGDLYELLYACDVMLSVHSTTISEAIIFDKPVIMLQSPGSIDPIGWAEQGVAMPVRDAKELREMVQCIWKDGEVGGKLKEARNRFIRDHYFKIDRKSTERVVSLIERLGKRE